MTVSRMLKELPASELTEWMAYFDLQKNPPPIELTPEQKTIKLKQSLFKGKAP